jgi:hypothetical protein
MQTINYKIGSGTLFESIITVEDDSHLPFDLTGFNVRAQMAQTLWSSVKYPIDVSVYNPTVPVGQAPVVGQILLRFDPLYQTTYSLKYGRYQFDCVIYNNDNSIILPVAHGEINFVGLVSTSIQPLVTQATVQIGGFVGGNNSGSY